MDLNAVRDAVETALETVSGLRAFAYQPDVIPAPPVAIVGNPEMYFDETMGRGFDRVELPVVVYVSSGVDRRSQEMLDDYMAGSGAKSIKAAIVADKTLGGAVDVCRVSTARALGPQEVADGGYFGAIFELICLDGGT